MKTITFFDTDEELLELTGILRRDDLWDAGFDLDDWDFGFVSDEPWDHEFDCDGHYYMDFILRHMDDYCCGYRHVEYRGKHYYMAYHS